MIKNKLSRDACTSRKLSSGGESLVESLETVGLDPQLTAMIDVDHFD